MSLPFAVASQSDGKMRYPAPRLGRRSGPIVARIAAESGVAVHEITGPGRSRKVSQARQAAAYALRSEAGLSLHQICFAIGRRNHTTILHAIHAHCDRTGLPLPPGLTSTFYVERRRARERERALRHARKRAGA